MSPLKVECFSLLIVDGRDSKGEKDSVHPCGLEDGGAAWRDMRVASGS